MIATGEPAPDIVLTDTDGDAVRLSDFHGESGVLLFFMRATSCPVCRAHVRDLARRRDDLLAHDVRVLIAVPEDRGTAAAWQARSRTPFPVLTGRDGYAAFGLARRLFGTVQQSGSVLVDRHGVVRHAHATTSPLNAYDRAGITAALADWHAPAHG
ncbi:MAG TPA: peroxiredoxin family protein [Actinocatenispora sp.]